ncbi:MAG: calcium/sodium antiporter [Bacteroidales bacterium]
MILNILLLVLSLVLLYLGADFLVKGSSSMAVRFGIPPLIVGLTIVSLGTSSPELLVSIKSALMGQPELAAGNVIGSNIFNIGAILGICAMIAPLTIKRSLIKQDIPFFLFAALAVCVLFYDGEINRWEALVFCAGAIFYTVLLIRNTRKSRKSQSDKVEKTESEIVVTRKWYLDLLFIVIGLVLLVFGSNLLVDKATLIARFFNVSEAIIGLTIVAAGTGMPELATSVVATLKGNKDIAIGNVIGSNIYNIFLVLGVTSIIKPIDTAGINYIDTFTMLLLSFLLVPLLKTGYVLKRWEGFLLFSIYIVYLLYLLKIIG